MTARPIYLLLLPLLMLTGCQENLMPQQVAEKFWQAVENRDVQAIKYFTAEGTISSGDISEHLLPVHNVRFGKTLIDGDHAAVETEVEVMADDPLNVPLDTQLVMQNEEWRVDYNSTVAAVRVESSLAKLLDQLNIFGDRFKDKVDESVDEFEKQIPEVERKLEEVEELLKEKIPEIRDRVEEFTRKLEEALRRSPSKQQQPGNEPRAI